MGRPPELDGRRSAELHEQIKSFAPYYVDNWDPDTKDVGSALVQLFAEMGGELTERVDRVPRKHRATFYDTLGFDRRPPQAATVPVSFMIDEGAPENVAISGGTKVEAKTDADEEVFRFASDDAFEATPARLTHVFSVDSADDSLFEHHDAIEGMESSPLFAGRDIQKNVLYIGHPERLAISGGSTVVLRLNSEIDPLELDWEYFGNSGNENEEETWREIGVTDTDDVDDKEDENGSELILQPAGSVVETTVSGVENSWIRCKVPPEEQPTGSFDAEFEKLYFKRTENQAIPEGMFANDVPQPIDDGEILPFGSIPRLRDAFYIACREAFTKTGATVTITFKGLNKISPVDEPRLSWEYYDGRSWQLLPGIDRNDVFHEEGGDDTEATVQFTAPPYIDSTAVSGQKGVWIRVRLVAGEYVAVTDVSDNNEDPTENQRNVNRNTPAFKSVSITYSYDTDEEPTHLLAENGWEYTDNLVEKGGPYRPFEMLPDSTQTVYFGMDRPLIGGPIQLYFDVADREYPGNFTPRVQWEYCVDPDADTWERLASRDDTEGLTQSGIVPLSFREETSEFRRFGAARHWLRARVRGDAFEPVESRVRSINTSEPNDVGATGDGSLKPCRPFLKTALGEKAVRPAAPLIDGIYLNTGLAANVTIVEDEVLGSSDGSPNLEVGVSRPPALQIKVWVNEATALSSDERERLEAERPDEIFIETDSSDHLRAAWVQWKAVDDLVGSEETDRHYVLNRVEGTISFGNGRRGRIPPHGQDNIRASYRTGGGRAGNVEPGAVENLSTPIPNVDAVTNPVSGSGGAEAETTEMVMERAPQELRHRGRAVTAGDFERIAKDSARRLAKVKCLSGMNREGSSEPGWITVLIVPDERREKPVPSAGLLKQVKQRLRERAPLHLIMRERDRLVVRGPGYVEIAVHATVAVERVESISAFEDRVDAEITAFLHPLSGGPSGDGWPFGERPHLSNLYAFLEGIERVDHVKDLSMTFTIYDRTISISEGDPPPSIAQDQLIHNGMHDIRVVQTETIDSTGGS